MFGVNDAIVLEDGNNRDGNTLCPVIVKQVMVCIKKEGLVMFQRRDPADHESGKAKDSVKEKRLWRTASEVLNTEARLSIREKYISFPA